MNSELAVLVLESDLSHVKAENQDFVTLVM